MCARGVLRQREIARANNVRPYIAHKLAASRCGPMTSIGPYRMGSRENSAPEGSTGEKQKSVKNRAALLHGLAFLLLDHRFGVPRGERLAAHNERRQFATQTRSCGYSPRWGEHCSLPSFAALNCGPLLATPQAPKPGLPRYRK